MKSSKTKVLHEVCGTPMLEMVLQTAHSISSAINIVVASPNNINEISALCGKFSNTEVVLQNEQLGTGHAVKTAFDKSKNLSNFNGNIYVLYGDTPLITSRTLQKMQTIQNTALTVLGFTSSNPQNNYGRLVCEEVSNIEFGTLSDITEIKDNPSARNHKICNSGVFLGRSEVFKQYLPKILPSTTTNEYYLTSLPSLIKQNCHYILCDESEVLGVNSRSELATCEGILQNRLRKFHMENGVTIIDPNSTFFSLDTKIESDVTIEPNVQMGKNVSIQKNSIIKSFSYIEGVNIGQGCQIGPFARIRPTTTIGNNSKIGNFVEVKNSNLAHSVKSGHLSYIGDTDISENVNIGAGTVFCNYDGFSKYRSNVEEDVFIGSNSTIISPISIKNNSIIAAGTVVTDEVPPNSIAISRSDQINISDGATRFRQKHHKP